MGNLPGRKLQIHHAEEEYDLTDVMEELQRLVGLKEVKEIICEIQAYLTIQQKRANFGLKTENLTLHMIFKGNPGSGKTTVARILGKLFTKVVD